MKRILLVSPFPPSIGGVSVSTQRLYENLVKDGFDVEKYNICYNKQKYNIPILLAIRFFCIPFFIVLKRKYDIIHFHVPGVSRKVFVSFFKIFYKRAKVVYTIHGDVKYLLLNKACLRALSKADKIICVQLGDSRRLPDYLSVKAVDNPAFIMPAHISEGDLSQEILYFSTKDDLPMMLFYGVVRLEAENFDLYGINDVVHLYQTLKNNHQKVKLLMFISYNTNDEKELQYVYNTRANFIGDEDVLIIENNRTSIVSLYKYAQVYLRLTKTDGDSLAIRESLAMGCPVIASNNSVRPKQCIVYNNTQDLYLKTIRVLFANKINETSTSMKNDYYDNLIKIYGSLL